METHTRIFDGTFRGPSLDQFLSDPRRTRYGKLLRAAREHEELSQEELGFLIGVTGDQIYLWERGSRPSKHLKELMPRVAKALPIIPEHVWWEAVGYSMEEVAASALGDALRTRRRELKLSPDEVATAAGIHRNTLRLWEDGHWPRNDTAARAFPGLARKLKLSEDWLWECRAAIPRLGTMVFSDGRIRARRHWTREQMLEFAADYNEQAPHCHPSELQGVLKKLWHDKGLWLNMSTRQYNTLQNRLVINGYLPPVPRYKDSGNRMCAKGLHEMTEENTFEHHKKAYKGKSARIDYECRACNNAASLRKYHAKPVVYDGSPQAPTKKCGGPCGKTKPRDDFYARNASVDGKAAVCIECDKRRKRKSR